MSKQTSLHSFFKSRRKVNHTMENTTNYKKRSLSLIRTPRSPKTLKKANEMQVIEVKSLSSSSEDLLTPPMSLKTPLSSSDEPVNMPTSSIDMTPTSSNKSSVSSQTIVYSLSPRNIQSGDRDYGTPNTRGSAKKFFSPTKKRLVVNRSPAKKKLNFQFTERSAQQNVEENKRVTHFSRAMDDKTLFLHSMIAAYLNNNSLKYLLDSTLQELLSKCLDISEQGLRVVCRLFWRHTNWYTVEDLRQVASDKDKYAISDMQEIIASLTHNNIIITSQNAGEDSMTFDDYVKILKKDDLTKICKDLKLKIQSKQDAVHALRRFCSRQQLTITQHFTGKATDNSARVLNMLRTKTGVCYKLSDNMSTALHNLHVLMFLGIDYTVIRERKLEFLLLHDKAQKEIYPIDKNMVVDDASVVFQNKEQFDRYLIAHRIYEDFVLATETQVKCELVRRSYELYKNISIDDMNCYKTLPLWLRRYTPANIFVKMMEGGVQELKKLRENDQYLFAVDILDLLISQNDFRQHKKAQWYTEKALILHKHLDSSQKAAESLLEGFESDLSEETKDAMRPRAKLIANQRNIVLEENMRQNLREYAEQDHVLENSLPADHVYKLPMDNYKQKGKLKFEIHTDDGRSTVTAEDYCVFHYKHNGEFTHGEHCEGRMVVTMYFLLFWDIIYTKPKGISGIFLNHYQQYPLDMHTEQFYENRKQLIEDRLTFIEESTEDMIVELMQNRWEERPEHEVSPINRDFKWPQLEGVVRCLGVRALGAICRRLATNYGYTHSGFPDLTLWNIHTKQVKFVEVKTDADRPSMKQLQWLQYLTSHKMAAGFCYVGANTTRCKARSRNTTLIT